MPRYELVDSSGAVLVSASVTVQAGGNTIEVNSAAALTSALANSANWGKTILLADGSYGNLTLTQKPSVLTTIQAKNPGGATMGTLFFDQNAKNLKVARMKGGSLKIGLSTDCTAEACDLSYIEIAAYNQAQGSATVPVRGTVRGCKVVVSGDSDAIYWTAGVDCMIEQTQVTNVNQNAGTNHADVCQVFPYWKVDGCVFRKNWIYNNPSAQGFFVKDARSTRVVCEDNLFEGGFTGPQQLISIYSSDAAIVRRNTLWVGPGSMRFGDGDTGAWTVEGNVLKTIFADPGPVPPMASWKDNVLPSSSSLKQSTDFVVPSGGPQFVDPANHDYRLKGGLGYPASAGVTWKPTSYGTAWVPLP